MAGLDGRGSGEAGCELHRGHQDLRTERGQVKGCGFLHAWPLAFPGLTHTQLLQQATVLGLSL